MSGEFFGFLYVFKYWMFSYFEIFFPFTPAEGFDPNSTKSISRIY